MKIIVTGGAGFIGGNFVHHMVNKYPEYQIINLDLLTYAGNLETLKPVEDKPNYKFVHGDIADRDFVFKLFEEEKPLLHGDDPASYLQPVLFFQGECGSVCTGIP